MTVNNRMLKVITLCEKYWAKNEKNCSGFVKDVASDLGIAVTGQANDIVDQLTGGAHWKLCKDGIDARQKAIEGKFVVGGLKAMPNGHVVIVVRGPLAHGKYPTAYWGSLGGVGKKNATINWSWNKTDRDLVTYAYSEFSL